MAILTIVTTEGVTKEVYEQLRKEVDWEQNNPQGEIFHAAGVGRGNNNVRVVGVWASENDFNNFVTSRLAPVLKKKNIPIPKAEIFDLQNMNIFPTAEKYKIAQAH